MKDKLEIISTQMVVAQYRSCPVIFMEELRKIT
jgi:hypothetical protein